MPDTLLNTFLSCFSRRFLIEKDLDVNGELCQSAFHTLRPSALTFHGPN